MPDLRRALAWLGLTDEEDDYEEDEVAETAMAGESTLQASRVQVISPVGSPGVQRRVDEEQSQQPSEAEMRAKLRAFPSTPERLKIFAVKPTRFADAQEIGDRLKAEQTVLVNFEGVDKDLRRRIIDFSSGLAYALGGKLREMGSNVYLLAPSRVEVDDDEMYRLRQSSTAKGVGVDGN
jgi:cell division inhibitor SepF